MNLGEKIYALRIEKNLSQGALADMLGVSRQSVSKWENNSAVPDLDKIVELSEIFGVSLDELVKGKSAIKNNNDYNNKLESEINIKGNNFEQNKVNASKFENAETDNRQIIYVTQKREGRKTAGVVLLCMAFAVLLFCTLLGDFLTGFVFQIPFLICGIICLTVKKNPGLICAWVMGFLLDAYFRWATGISYTTVLRSLQWTYEMNYMRLAIAWIQVAYILTLIIVTIIRLKKGQFQSTSKNRNILVAGWMILIAIVVSTQIVSIINLLGEAVGFSNLGLTAMLILALIDWIKFGLFTVLIIFTIRYFRAKKLEK